MSHDITTWHYGEQPTVSICTCVCLMGSISEKGLFVKKYCGLRTQEVRQHWGIFILLVGLMRDNAQLVPSVTTDDNQSSASGKSKIFHEMQRLQTEIGQREDEMFLLWIHQNTDVAPDPGHTITCKELPYNINSILWLRLRPCEGRSYHTYFICTNVYSYLPSCQQHLRN